MRTPHWLLALAVGLGALLAAPAAESPKADAERIAKLVKQLGSDSFEEREKAAKELEDIGAPALDALRAAAKDGDAEVKTRAGALIAKVEKGATVEKLLAPTKVKLAFKDTPLDDAVAEFNKKSGYTIQVHDPDKKLKDRKVTLDTGEVTFWEAFDKFCDKADLVEATWQDLMPKAAPGAVPPDAPKGRTGGDKKDGPEADEPAAAADDPPPAQAAPPPLPPPPPINQPPGAGGPPFPGGFGFGTGPGVILVVDGKPKSVPTCYSGSVRLCALKESPNLGFGGPFGAPGAGRGAAKDDNYTVWVELRGEPKLQVLGIESVALTKTADDQDQKLEVAAPPGPPVGAPGLPGAAPPGPAPPGGGRGPAMAPVMPTFMSGLGGTQYHVVRLKKGEKESKALKELAGTITAGVMPPAWPLITADKITKAEGQTFKGKDGGALKVAEVKEEDGKLTVQFELEQPLGYLPASTGGITAAGGRGGAAPPGSFVVPAPGVTLVDENGKTIPQTGGAPPKYQFVPGSVRKGTYTQEYKLDKDQKPAKLVFSASRMVNLDVPFTFKDVPLR